MVVSRWQVLAGCMIGERVLVIGSGGPRASGEQVVGGMALVGAVVVVIGDVDIIH